MYKVNWRSVEPRPDICGEIRELYSTENQSLAHVIVTGTAKKHKHNVMEEVYYITKGKGKLYMDGEISEITEGDTIPIPKNAWHYLIKTDEPLELVVTTYPKFDPVDVIEE